MLLRTLRTSQLQLSRQHHSVADARSANVQGCAPAKTVPIGGGRRRQLKSAVAVASDVDVNADGLVAYENVAKLLQQKTEQDCKLQAARLPDKRVVFVFSRNVNSGEVVLEVPESLTVTSVDANQHPTVGPVAENCSELVALTLWLMAERYVGAASPFAPLIGALPDYVLSPLLWDDDDRVALLAGSPILAESRARAQALHQQWAELNTQYFSKNIETFPPVVYNESNFCTSFCVVLASAQYLPAAECFALLPVASQLQRTGNEDGLDIDYDAQCQAVVLTTRKAGRDGCEARLNDGRPNGELVLATGSMQDNNSSDWLGFKASLVPADKLFSAKQQVLQMMGLSNLEVFPVYKDRMPLQLLTYLRLARIQDSAQLAKVSFDSDSQISQANEYEILQILMGDCREGLAAYRTSLEEDRKSLMNPQLSQRERLATRLRVAEKAILSQTMDAVRRRLAPIRGIPTKAGGLQDPNADLKEIFDFIEDIPKAPKRMLDNLQAWARGDFDPDWKKPPR